MAPLDFIVEPDWLQGRQADLASSYAAGSPFPHVVIDNFLPERHAEFLLARFPPPMHPVWLDWRKRGGHQYRKLGAGSAERFASLDPYLWLALNEFNSWKFIQAIEAITGIGGLLPDPYFTGGGMHQILKDGFLDIHTDFNDYSRVGLFRRLNVLLYLNKDWAPTHGGALELWDKGPPNGSAQRTIAPHFNRGVIFDTNKKSFHGHPTPWSGPPGTTRKSIALYFYTAKKVAGADYDFHTDFQGVNFRDPVS